MIRYLKVLSLASLAILALTAIGASAASAAEFVSSTSPTTIEGTQTTANVFTVNSRTIGCEEAKFTGTQFGLSAATWEVHPEYGRCTGFGLPATVTTSGCAYRFDVIGGFTPNFTGHMFVSCGTGSITITVTGCTVTVPSQGGALGLLGVSYNANGSTVTVSTNVTTLSAVVSGNVLICGTNGTRPLTYTGSDLFKGNGGAANIGVM
jgi:hypothetical protein